jgi:DNA-binding MarR family transcriptional regulator
MYEDHVPAPRTSDRQAVFALSELITLVRQLGETLKEVARDLHEDRDVSVPARAVLLELRKSGPLTVPELARRREVSRQFIQVTVNPLLEAGVLVAQTNPAHRRSKLLALSDQGTELIRQVMRREGGLLREWATDLTADEIRQAVTTLENLQQVVQTRPR